MLSASDYADQFLAHLPQGRLWPRSRGSKLWDLGAALGKLLADLRARVGVLLRESDPRETAELLTEWETAYGLLGICDLEGLTLAQRRDVLVQRVSDAGGQSIAYFVHLAAQIGWAIEIEELRSFGMGTAQMGDAIGDETLDVAWIVHAPPYSPKWFAAGSGAAGDPLQASDRELLECVITEAAPAHTNVAFVYDLTPEAGPWTEILLQPASAPAKAGLISAQS